MVRRKREIKAPTRRAVLDDVQRSLLALGLESDCYDLASQVDTYVRSVVQKTKQPISTAAIHERFPASNLGHVQYALRTLVMSKRLLRLRRGVWIPNMT